MVNLILESLKHKTVTRRNELVNKLDDVEFQILIHIQPWFNNPSN